MRRTAKGLVAMAGVLMTTLVLFMAGPALAGGGYPPSPTQTVVAQKVTPPAPAVQAVQSKVAFTGADILQWVLMALAALLVGTVLVVAARRRRTEV